MKRTLLLICTVVFFMALFGGRVQAEGLKDTVLLPVSQTVLPDDNENPDDFTVNYILTADNSDNPMPKGSENGVYRFSVRGNGKFEIPFPEFTRQGIWHYTLCADGEGLKFAYSELKISVYEVFDGEKFYTDFLAQLPDGKKTDLTFSAGIIPQVADVSAEPSYEISESSCTEESFSGYAVNTGDRKGSELYSALVISGVLIILLMRKNPKRNKKYQQL